MSSDQADAEDESFTLQAHFDPVVCARLHNELVALAASLDPMISQSLIQGAFARYNGPIRHPRDPETPLSEYLTEDVNRFLTQISVFRSQRPHGMMPFVFPPDLNEICGYADEEANDDHPYMIRLYPNCTDQNAGGLYFDQATNLAQIHGSYMLETPPAENWMEFEPILRKWLRLWDTGKIAYGEKADDSESANWLFLQPWTENERVATLEAWEGLLLAIVSRMPPGAYDRWSSDKCYGIMSLQDIERCDIRPGPLRDFLVKARAPPPVAQQFRFRIAPSTFLLTASTRSTYFPPRADPRYQSELLFAAIDDTFRSLEESLEDLSTVGSSQRSLAGFYLSPSTLSYPDRICYLSPALAPNGLADLADHRIRSDKRNSVFCPLRGNGNVLQCPWNPQRPMLMTDMFQVWRRLIENGVWQVDQNGVVGSVADLESAGRNAGRLNWSAIDV